MSADGFGGLLAYGKNSTKDKLGSMLQRIAVFTALILLLVTSFQDNDVKARAFDGRVFCGTCSRRNQRGLYGCSFVSLAGGKTCARVGSYRLKAILNVQLV